MRRPQIDPKALRTHSQIVEKSQTPPMVVGSRNQTDYGFFVEGSKTKAFETQFLTVMPRCMTPTWKHNKKTRVYRVVSGVGSYQVFTDASDEGKTVGTMTEKMLTYGDEIVVSADTIHRITAGPAKLEMYVTQDSKYESSLAEVLPAEVVAHVPESDLTSLSRADKESKITFGMDRTMRSSRAAEQIAANRQERGARAPAGRTSSDFFHKAPGDAGINAKPVMNFDSEGAG